MLSVIMLSGSMLSVIMLSVNMLSAIILSFMIMDTGSYLFINVFLINFLPQKAS